MILNLALLPGSKDSPIDLINRFILGFIYCHSYLHKKNLVFRVNAYQYQKQQGGITFLLRPNTFGTLDPKRETHIIDRYYLYYVDRHHLYYVDRHF